jgi:hypothetical protein
MTFEGHVKNGVVLLDNGATLPEGARVHVKLVPADAETVSADDAPTLYESLARFIGKAEGLPPDMSINLDHYLYGVPKRE